MEILVETHVVTKCSFFLFRTFQKRSDLNGNSSITFVTSEAPRVVVESSSVDNEILKNRAASMTIPESQTQGKKNVTQ